jgi:uncharacterized lipoprotein
MNISYGRTTTATIIVGMMFFLVACGTMDRLDTGEAVAYKEAQIRPPLAVPEGLNEVPLNPANELQQLSSVDQAAESRIPPSAGLVEKAVIEEESSGLAAEPEVSSDEPIITVVITGRDARLNTSHPVHIVWQAVGLGLQRLTIPITDRDRSNGLYFVDCLSASGEEPKKKRWWSILSKDDSTEPAVCELSIAEESESIAVRISSSAEGVPSDQQIVDLLEELKIDLDRV